MAPLAHVLLFSLSILVLWAAARFLVSGIDRYARRHRTRGFVVAFFILGVATSISELSVAGNSLLKGVPEVSSGNLIGASFVILFLIIPLLAIANRGVRLTNTLSARAGFITLLAIIAPAFLVIDQQVSFIDGVLALIMYGAALLTVKSDGVRHTDEHLPPTASFFTHAFDLSKVLIAAIVIFFASDVLVDQSLYFASLLSVPEAVIGILLLSIGTNVPELTVALRSIFVRKPGIAFGNYMGSALSNTFIFGGVALVGSPFAFQSGIPTLFVTLFSVGALCFFIATQTKRTISVLEGALLLVFYVAFVTFQIAGA